MDGSDVEDALDAAEAAFRDARGQRAETGLDVADEALVQLRKACRLLEAARTLRDRNGYYTVVIEASFVAVERSIQFYLLHRGRAAAEEIRHEHDAVYRRGAEVNLFSESFAARLIEIWQQNRADVYYRETVASAEQADAMLRLAEAVHRYVVEFGSMEHDCVCSTTRG